jgi:hypothetical protein
MTARDSDDDLRKYMPDRATILREADPRHAEEKYRSALANPELDEALAEVRTGPQAKAKAKVKAGAVATPREPSSAKGSRVRLVLPRWLIHTLAVLAVLVPAALVLVFTRASQGSLTDAGGRRALGAGVESASGASQSGASPQTGAVTDAGTGTDAGTVMDAGTGTMTMTDTDAGAGAEKRARATSSSSASALPSRTKAKASSGADPYAPSPSPARSAEPARQPEATPSAPAQSEYFD